MTHGARNAIVLVLTLLVVALLFAFPTSRNHTGTRHPSPSASAGVQGGTPRTAPGR